MALNSPPSIKYAIFSEKVTVFHPLLAVFACLMKKTTINSKEQAVNKTACQCNHITLKTLLHLSYLEQKARLAG